MNLTTPCHGVPFLITYTWEGRPYLQERVVEGFECTESGCYNVWDADGKAVT